MNNVLLKYLTVRDNKMPQELHQIPSRHCSFFIKEIMKKFGKKALQNQDGKMVNFTYIFSRASQFEIKALKKLCRDVRCFFNKLCMENPDKFYMEVAIVDWSKYDYQFF